MLQSGDYLIFIINMDILSIWLAQLEISWEDPEANLQSVIAALAEADPMPRGLVVFPEMMPTGFTQNLQHLAPESGGQWESQLDAELRRRDLTGLVGMARRHANGEIGNDAVFLGAEVPPAGSYQKIRPFKKEAAAVSRGHEVRVFTFKGAKVCPLICYDLRFPELFREGLRKGAEVFLVMANWPEARHHHWELLLQARAVENQAFVLGVNRAGTDPDFNYLGGSMAVDPHGQVLYHAGEAHSVNKVDIDLKTLREWREAFPAVNDFLSDPFPA